MNGSVLVGPGGKRFACDPTRCMRPLVLVRVNLWPHWSRFWCPEHGEYVWDIPAPILAYPNDPELPTFLRRGFS